MNTLVTLVDFQLQKLVVPGTDLGTQRTGFYIPSIWRKSQLINSHVVRTNVMFTTHDWKWSIQPIKIVIWGMVYGMCFIHMTCVFLAEKFQKTMCGPTRKLLSNFRKFQWWDSDPSLHLLIHSTSIHIASPAMAGWWLTYTPLKNHGLRQLG